MIQGDTYFEQIESTIQTLLERVSLVSIFQKISKRFLSQFSKLGLDVIQYAISEVYAMNTTFPRGITRTSAIERYGVQD